MARLPGAALRAQSRLHGARQLLRQRSAAVRRGARARLAAGAGGDLQGGEGAAGGGGAGGWVMMITRHSGAHRMRRLSVVMAGLVPSVITGLVPVIPLRKPRLCP